MFGLGPTELIVILVLGVLLLGPQRIPEAAASLGKAIRSFRRATRELRDQIDIEDEVRRPLEDLRAALRDEPPPYIPPPPSNNPPLISPPSEQILSTAEEPAAGALDGEAHATATPATATAPTGDAATAPAATAPAATGTEPAGTNPPVAHEPVGAPK